MGQRKVRRSKDRDSSSEGSEAAKFTQEECHEGLFDSETGKANACAGKRTQEVCTLSAVWNEPPGGGVWPLKVSDEGSGTD